MDAIPKAVDLPTYQRIMAEGEKLEKIGSFDKAITAYTKAFEAVAPNGPLEDPIGRNCLCARSGCYLQVGNHELALKDAELALKEDKAFIKGIFAKAEALYFKGDFEFALVYFHRGNKLRGELQEFRLGIQKAREAIINAVGSPEACPLEVPADTGFQRSMSASSKNTLKKPPRTQETGGRQTVRAPPAAPDRSVRQLLGELYADRQYLESLLSEPWAAGDENDMATLVQGGINYLDTRTDFWRQQKPIYAREYEQKQRTLKKPLSRTQDSTSRSTTSAAAPAATDGQIPFADIDTMLDDNEASEAVALATKWLAKTKSPAARARLQCAIGDGNLDLDNAEAAHKAFAAALPDARAKGGDAAVLARALGGAGRALVRLGRHRDALPHYQECLTLTAEADQAWVLHEIGRCHLQLKDAPAALEAGTRARDVAVSDQWQLNSHVLVAEIHVEMSNITLAIESFDAARVLAQAREDEATLASINAALAQIRRD